jgi:hypothetical protein
MSIQVTSTSSHVVITNGANVRSINKQVIREISILRGTIIKIDIGGGALRNIFLPIADITLPDHPDNATLLNALNNMLVPLEIDLAEDISRLSDSMTTMQERLEGLLPASLQEPSIIDESDTNRIYSGFADIDATPDQPRWAIMRTTIQDDIITNEWADGTQAMTSVWDNRTALSYS